MLVQGRLDALTGLRAFAALAVVWQHYQVLPMNLPEAARIQYGYLGVDLFFILSGFVISHVHAREFRRPASLRQALAFYGLRLARIYPMHVVTLWALLAMFTAGVALHRYAAADLIHQWRSFVVNLLLLQAWWDQPLSWNFPAWSVSCEWFAYFLFPLLALAVARARPLIALVAITADGLLFVWVYGHWFQHSLDWNSGLALIRVTMEFTLGAFLWRFASEVAIPGRTAGALVLLAAGITAGAYLLDRSSFEPLVVATLALVILAGSQGNNWLSRFLARPPFVYLGEISYSIYMVHIVVLKAAVAVIGGRLEQWPLSARCVLGLLLIAATLLAAATSYRWIEAPARRWYRNRLMDQDEWLRPPPVLPLPAGR